MKGEKDPKSGPNIKIPNRDVGPSSTQVGYRYKEKINKRSHCALCFSSNDKVI